MILKKIREIFKFYLFDAFLNFSGTNTPDFKKVPLKLNYDDYWEARDIKKMNLRLRQREKIVFDYVKPKSYVMDYGCGFSSVLYHLKNKKRCKVIGFDVSQKAVDFQKKHGIKAKNIIPKNYLKEGKYDYIILTEILEHLTNPEELIYELKDKTKYFIVSVPNSAYFAYRLKLFFRGRISMQWMYHPSEHLRYWSHAEFLEWIDALGLDLISFKCTDGILTSINFLPNLLSWNIVYLFRKKNFRI